MVALLICSYEYAVPFFSMRIIVPVLILLTSSCNNDGGVDQNNRWSYRANIASRELTYDFRDGEKTQLVGSCNGDPNYVLWGGNYQFAEKFTLTVDDRNWTLPAWQGEHGRGLFVEQLEPSVALGRAKRRIIFRVGSWHREFRPAPLLKQFATDCV